MTVFTVMDNIVEISLFSFIATFVVNFIAKKTINITPHYLSAYFTVFVCSVLSSFVAQLINIDIGRLTGVVLGIVLKIVFMIGLHTLFFAMFLKQDNGERIGLFEGAKIALIYVPALSIIFALGFIFMGLAVVLNLG